MPKVEYITSATTRQITTTRQDYLQEIIAKCRTQITLSTHQLTSPLGPSRQALKILFYFWSHWWRLTRLEYLRPKMVLPDKWFGKKSWSKENHSFVWWSNTEMEIQFIQNLRRYLPSTEHLRLNMHSLQFHWTFFIPRFWRLWMNASCQGHAKDVTWSTVESKQLRIISKV